MPGKSRQFRLGRYSYPVIKHPDGTIEYATQAGIDANSSSLLWFIPVVLAGVYFLSKK